MKKTVKFLTVILLISMVLSMGMVSACAEGNYTIRLYAGNRGTGGGTITAAPGQFVSLDGLLAGVTVSDSKFYVKGVVRAGYDSVSDGLANRSFAATEDADYVVVYGVAGDLVQYTVKYVNNNGTVLADETTGYANVGEKIVVGCKEVDGYLPNTYNYSMTLSGNAASNVFTFIYTKIQNPQEPVNPVNPGGDNGNGNAGDNNANGGDNGNGVSNEVRIEPVQPQQIIDLDEQQVPLAPGADEEGKLSSSIATPLLVGALVAFLGLLALVIVLAKRKKDKNRGYEG